MSNLLYCFSGMIHAPTLGATVLSSLFPLVSTSGSQRLERGLSLLESVLVRVTVAVKSHHEYGNLEVKAFHWGLAYSPEGEVMRFMVGSVMAGRIADIQAGRHAWNSRQAGHAGRRADRQAWHIRQAGRQAGRLTGRKACMHASRQARPGMAGAALEQ